MSVNLVTCADDTGIFLVKTVIDEPPVVGALPEKSFVPLALHFVQEDFFCAFTKTGFSHGRGGSAAPELTAHHVSISSVPGVVANRSPDSVVKYFNTALTSVLPIHQPQGEFFGRQKEIRPTLGVAAVLPGTPAVAGYQRKCFTTASQGAHQQGKRALSSSAHQTWAPMGSGLNLKHLPRVRHLSAPTAIAWS